MAQSSSILGISVYTGSECLHYATPVQDDLTYESGHNEARALSLWSLLAWGGVDFA